MNHTQLIFMCLVITFWGHGYQSLASYKDTQMFGRLMEGRADPGPWVTFYMSRAWTSKLSLVKIPSASFNVVMFHRWTFQLMIL